MSMPLFSMLARTGVSEVAPDVAAASSVAIQSLWDFILKGGVMMIPIGICSFIALAVFIERMVSLRRSKVIPAKFLPGLKKVLRETSGDGSAAITYCQKNGSSVSNVFAAGMKKLRAPIEILEKHIQEAGQREVLKLRKYLRALAVIASITPLMGLLGTIFGMIAAFQTVATSADALGKTELLAAGIYQAMITTAAGLVVAIPVLIAFHIVSAKIERLVMDIDLMTVEFIEEFAEMGLEPQKEGEPVSGKKKRKRTPGRDSDSRLESSSVQVAT